MADVKPDPIFQVASGFLAAKHLFVAAEIGCSRNSLMDQQRWRRWVSEPAFPSALCGLLPTPWSPSILSNGKASATAIVLLRPLSLPAQVNLIFARSCTFGTASVIYGMQGLRTLFAPTR